METDRSRERIVTLSRRLRWAVRAIVVLVAILLLIVLLGMGGESARFALGGARIDIGDVGMRGRLLLLACAAPIAAVGLALLREADRLLGLYEKGVVFAPENGRLIRRSGQLLMVLAVLNTLFPLLLVLVDEATSGLGIDEFSLDLEIGLFLAGLFVVVIGHVMSLGAELAEDQALTI